MATYDPLEQKLYLRVVYDGAASAGKTTNVLQLGNLVVAQHKSAVVSPEELCGRTLYFDWLQISGGSICGLPLVCQVISVPGQDVFAARRRHLLSLADVVVLVADASQASLDRTRTAVETTRSLLARADGAPPPLVLQANKQDQVGALGGDQLASALQLQGAEVLEAIASDGIGVVDTFVAAVRIVARDLRAEADEGRLRIAIRRSQDEHELLAQLTTFDIDPEGAAELLLEQAQAAFDAELARGAKGVRVDQAALDRAIELPLDERNPSVTAPSPELQRPAMAPLPTTAVPTGFVWPAHTGRALLSELDLREEVALDDTRASWAHGSFVLSTSTDAYYTDMETARQALVRSARERTQLDTLLVEGTVLVVQPSVAGTGWLWTITPETGPIGPWLSEALQARTEALAAAIVTAIALTLDHGLLLSPALEHFRVQDGTVRYAGTLSKIEGPAPLRAQALAGFLLAIMAEACASGAPELALATSVARRLQARVSLRDLEELMTVLQNRQGSTDAESGIVDALLRLAEAA